MGIINHPLSLLFSPITLLSKPLISSSILLTILTAKYFPGKLQTIIPSSLLPYLTCPTLTSPTTIITLGAFFTLSILRRVNRVLSDAQLNNWRGGASFAAVGGGKEGSKENEEVVLITGGAGSLGLLMAKGFVKWARGEGRMVKVVIVDLNPPKEEIPEGIFFYQLDVTSSEQISEVGKKIRNAHGDPTVLINNAGVAFCRPLLGGGAKTEECIRTTFEVNILSHYWIIREFLPAIAKKNHGHVVTISSMAAFVVHAQNVDYSCTKTSTQAFHEGLASELKHRYNAPDVKTTLVHPTWVDTPLIKPLIENPDFKDLVLKPEYVATQIVNQVISGRSAQLILPPQATFLSGFRGWPSWLQERIRNRMGHQLEFYKDWEKDGAFF